jgi:uncharacterized membrane protein
MIPAELFHPMLVHFPLALFPAAIALDLWILGRGGDLAARQTLPQIALLTYVAATVLALAAILLGGIAFDTALQNGFAEAPIEAHEETAKFAFYVFAAVTAIRLFVYFRKTRLMALRGAALTGLAVVGYGIMLLAAWRGGELVYAMGVNVAHAMP